MAKLKELFLIPVFLGGTASIDSQKLEDIVTTEVDSRSNYSLMSEQINQQQNGYLDYMAAIDFLMKNNFDAKSNTRLANSRNGKSTYLKEIKTLVAEYVQAINLVKIGNKKQVYADSSFLETREEISKIEEQTFHIPRLLFFDSYQSFAAGNSVLGLQSFFDIFVFGEKLAGSGGTRNYMRGTSMESIAFNEAENLLPRMSQPDLKKLENFCLNVLKYDNLAAMLQRQLPQQLNLIDRVISGNYRGLAREGNVIDEEIAKTVADQVAKLNPPQRQELKEAASKALVNHVNSYLNMLARPESEWKAPGTPDIYLPFFGNLSTLFDLVDTPVPTVLFTAARQRTQYRLLFLYSKIEQYRWENAKLPASLDELKDPKTIYDPLSDGNFEYKITKENALGYEIFSNGSKNPDFDTGKIFLAPRRRE